MTSGFKFLQANSSKNHSTVGTTSGALSAENNQTDLQSQPDYKEVDLENHSNDNVPKLTLGEASDIIGDVLKGFSSKDIRTILKMIGGAHDLKVTSAYAPVGIPLSSLTRQPAERGQVKPRIQLKADSKVKTIRSEIGKLNREISKKSAITGSTLPLEDELLVMRAKYFRDLKEAQNTTSSTS
jgi:hypothetical protein